MVDTIQLVGKLVEGDPGRDAIHVAVIPVTSANELALAPGQPVGFIGDDTEHAVSGVKSVGVVDPFLTDYVLKGQRFWLFLNPATITSLRHVWTHPAFAAEGVPAPINDKKAASEAWISNWLDRRGDNPGYDIVMQTIRDGGFDDGDYRSGRLEAEYLHFNGIDAHGKIPLEFWDHVEIVLGRKPRHRPASFSCSC